MAREQKRRNKASQTSGKGTAQSSQPKLPETVVAPEQQESTPTVSSGPTWPVWPTSQPGPRSTPPPPAMHPFNVFRPEQVSEVGYNQETGEPGSQSPLRSLPDASMKEQVSLDQQPAQPKTLSKRKKRL
jgi:hypothetical protein